VGGLAALSPPYGCFDAEKFGRQTKSSDYCCFIFVAPPLPTPLSDPPPPECDLVEAPDDAAAGADLPLPFGAETSAAPLETVTAVVPLPTAGDPGAVTSAPPLEIVTAVVPWPAAGDPGFVTSAVPLEIVTADPPGPPRSEFQPPGVAVALHALYFASQTSRHCEGKMHLPELW